MKRRCCLLLGSSLFLVAAPASALGTDTDMICRLVGKDTHNGTDTTSAHQPGLRLYGTDLGFSFKHKSQVVLLFGDTWIEEDSHCTPELADDALGFITLAEDDDPEDCLDIEFLAEMNGDMKPMEVWENGFQLDMGGLKTPRTGFSDGRQIYGVFSNEDQECTLAGCPDAMTCVAGMCFDPTSSQGLASSKAAKLKLAWARPTSATPELFTVGATWATNKFLNPTSRAIALFSETDPGSNVYEPGSSPRELLMWGRPGFWASQTGTADLYLLHHSLSAVKGTGSAINWAPRYFAGMNGNTPTWTSQQALAVPVIGLESQLVVNHTSVAWVEAIERWVLIYSGRVPRTAPVPESGIYMRTAPDPWGPWSEETLIWNAFAGGAYDCPGIMYAKEVVGPMCSETDAFRPNWFDDLNHCPDPSPDPNDDLGVEYGVNILDNFTAPGFAINTATIYWNMSTWNPYRVVLMRTDIDGTTIGIPP